MALHFFSSLTGCSRDPKVEWRPGINAPQHYPARIVSGSLTDGKNSASITSGVARYGGWGHGGLEMSTERFIPNKLSITWFSFAEDKFYRGTFALPIDIMRALFAQGCISANGVQTRYNYIVVNVYPEGGVALWMKSSGGRVVEIDHFQAEEIEYDWRSMFNSLFSDTREDYNKFIISVAEGAADYIAQHGVSPEPFKTVYRQRYNYTIVIDGITHADTGGLAVDFYNGETDMISEEELENNFFKTKAVPKYIYADWLENGVCYFGEITFDEEEIFKAFNDMSLACPDEPYVLYLKHDYSMRRLSVSLRSKTKEIEIEKTGKVGISMRQPKKEN